MTSIAPDKVAGLISCGGSSVRLRSGSCLDVAVAAAITAVAHFVCERANRQSPSLSATCKRSSSGSGSVQIWLTELSARPTHCIPAQRSGHAQSVRASLFFEEMVVDA